MALRDRKLRHFRYSRLTFRRTAPQTPSMLKKISWEKTSAVTRSTFLITDILFRTDYID